MRPVGTPVGRPVPLPVDIGRGGGGLPWEDSGGGRVQGPALITAFDGMSTTNHWAGAADGEPQAPFLGNMTIGIVVRIDAVPSAIEMWGAHGGNSGTDGGWSIGSNASAVLRGIVVDLGGTARVTPAYTIVAGDVGKYHTFCLTIDGTVIKMYRNGVIVGTSTVCVGYKAPNVALKTSIGCAYNTAAAINSATSVAVVGMLADENLLLSAANVTVWHDACVAARDVADFTGDSQYRWQASDNVGLASPWTDDIGGITLTRVGTGGTLVQEVPTWG